MDGTVQVQVLRAVISDVRHAAIIQFLSPIVPGFFLRQSILSSVTISVMPCNKLYMVSPTVSQVQNGAVLSAVQLASVLTAPLTDL